MQDAITAPLTVATPSLARRCPDSSCFQGPHNLSVELYPDDDHRVMIEKYKEVAQDIWKFIEGKDFPKESVYRDDVR